MTSPIANGAKGKIEEMVQMAQITTAEFAEALETDTRTVRKFLRAITPKEEQPGKGSRWVLEGNKNSINKMRKQFAAWDEARQAKAEEVSDKVETDTDAVEDELNLDD